MSKTETAEAARQRIGPVGVWLSSLNELPAAEAQAAARRIEELGYGALWIGETPVGREAMVHSGLLLAATTRLVVGTGIANIWVRDATAANAAATALAEAYDGRFILGLGVSHAPIVDSRGHDYRRPVAAMTAFLDGLDSATYLAAQPKQPAPTVIGALRPKMLELSRDRTSGAHPYFVTPEHTASAREILGASPLLAPEQAVLLDTDPATARRRAREHMAVYLQLPNYLNNLRMLGYDDADFSDGGSDRLVDAIVSWGDADAIRNRVRQHLDAGADHVAIQPIGEDARAALAQLDELAPALLS